MRRIVLAAALAVAMTSAADAGVTCYADINAGKTITSTKVSDPFAGSFTIAADGLQGGLGAGCDYEVSGIMHGLVIGVLGRYDLQDISTKIMGESISADGAWTAALRAGIKVNPGTLAYGILGMSWTEINLPGDAKLSSHGYVFGAGIEIDIGVPNLALYTEWSRTQWGKSTDFDTTIRPDSDTVRVGLKLKFGAADLPK